MSDPSRPATQAEGQVPEVAETRIPAASGRSQSSHGKMAGVASDFRLFASLSRVFEGVCTFFERRPWLLFALLMLVYLPAVEFDSMHKPLWHDELFTFHLSQLPTLAETWAAVQSMDLNPPLLYVLTRLSYAALGVNTLATRMPEIVFYMLALAGIFSFVKRRIGAMFGGFAVAVMLFGRTVEFAYEARPYALLLGCLAVALSAFSAAVENVGWRRAGACALLLAACCGMMLSHIFAVGAMAALVAAELWREVRNRRVDSEVLAVLLLPLTLIVFDLPILRGHGTAIFPAAFIPTFTSTTAFYITSVDREGFAFVVSGLAVLPFLVSARRRVRRLEPAASWLFTPPEWAALLLLVLEPLALSLELMHTKGAFFPRYGIVLAPAFLMAAAAVFARYTATQDGRPDARAGMIGMVVALILSNQTYDGLRSLAAGQLVRSAARSEPVPKPCQACAITSSPAAARDANDNLLPLVDASGLTFVEMAHREPISTLNRVFYLTDHDASTRIAHANIFERMQEVVDNFHLADHVEPYPRFIANHDHFYVLGRAGWQEDWLVPKLVEDGALVRPVAEVNDDYTAKNLWEVTFPGHPNPPPAQPAIP